MESWNAFISLLNEMSPYLLLGFLLRDCCTCMYRGEFTCAIFRRMISGRYCGRPYSVFHCLCVPAE